jgi:hypothetical protein
MHRRREEATSFRGQTKDHCQSEEDRERVQLWLKWLKSISNEYLIAFDHFTPPATKSQINGILGFNLQLSTVPQVAESSDGSDYNGDPGAVEVALIPSNVVYNLKKQFEFGSMSVLYDGVRRKAIIPERAARGASLSHQNTAAEH